MSDCNKTGQPPDSIWFRSAHWSAGTDFPENTLHWGKLMYSCKGLARITIKGNVYLSTPEFAIWLPAHTSHHSIAFTEIEYAIIHVHEKLCKQLPTEVETLKINGIIKEIIKDFSRRSVGHISSVTDINLANVLIEQLALCESFNCFLPLSEDSIISKITKKMIDEPDGLYTLKNWSDNIGLSERTLSRRFLSSTGINFNEWKLRRKVLLAISLLQEGKSVKYVSSCLGYHDPSAFIAMFRLRMGITPGQLVSDTPH
ncbi:TPA: helix-turn-helix domain-containing protein [Klebsiella aerogenes]|nr:helix-turn-helix domain-containing protein [Klebsiella aerogenes]